MRASSVRSLIFVLLALCAAAAAVYGLGDRAPTASVLSPRPIAGGSFEASAVVYVPGSPGVLFADDKDGRVLYWMELAADGTQRTPAQPVALGVELVDPEGLTTDGTHIFVVGSQSKGGDAGVSLARFTFDVRERRASDVRSMGGLKRFLAEHVRELREHHAAEALNIEGLAWDPTSRRLLLGLREPVVEGQALVVPLAFRRPEGPFTLENLEVPDGRAIPLDMRGGGIRSLEYDARARAFRAIGGPGGDSASRDFQLFEWNGAPDATLRELASFPRDLKAEGITPAVVDGRQRTVVVFDVGHFALYD